MKDNNTEKYSIGLYKIHSKYIKILNENLTNSSDIFKLIKIDYKI